jgi:hypothetical protein
MHSYRFGRKLKLPSTAAIKHQFLLMALADEIRAIPSGVSFKDSQSANLAKLRRLRNTRSNPDRRLDQ